MWTNVRKLLVVGALSCIGCGSKVSVEHEIAWSGYYTATFNVIVRELEAEQGKDDGLKDEYQNLANAYHVLLLEDKPSKENLDELYRQRVEITKEEVLINDKMGWDMPTVELLHKAQDLTNKRLGVK